MEPYGLLHEACLLRSFISDALEPSQSKYYVTLHGPPATNLQLAFSKWLDSKAYPSVFELKSVKPLLATELGVPLSKTTTLHGGQSVAYRGWRLKSTEPSYYTMDKGEHTAGTRPDDE